MLDIDAKFLSKKKLIINMPNANKCKEGILRDRHAEDQIKHVHNALRPLYELEE